MYVVGLLTIRQTADVVRLSEEVMILVLAGSHHASVYHD
jgi:hypothetical protein